VGCAMSMTRVVPDGLRRALRGGVVVGLAVAVVVAVGAVGGLGACAAGGGGTGESCGNGALDPGEQCDGQNLTGFTCETLPGFAFTGGDLSCSADCTMDTSACTGGIGVCGNGVLDASEICDGDDLGGEDCVSQGMVSGTLRCLADCSDFNLQSCTISETCGNGLRDGPEECDQSDLAGATCEILGYLGGTLDCQANCLFDESGCTDGTCGNGVVEGTEECDGLDLGGETCVSRGYGGGPLACSAACAFDETLCGPSTCDNGVVDAGEDCDGTDLAGADCVSQGFTGGTLACDTTCLFDTTGCTTSTCGDGVADAGEECDGADLGGLDCLSQGYAGGTLACSATCTLDESGCVTGSGCALMPFTEGFENGVPPPGGTHVDGDGFSLEWTSSSTAHGGSSSAYHGYDSTETDNDIMVLPCLDLGPYAGMTVTMTYWERNSLPGWYEGHYVVSSTSTTAPGSVSGYTQVMEMGSGSSSWNQATVDLTSLAGQPTVWIGFRYYGSNADYWYVDDVSISVN